MGTADGERQRDIAPRGAGHERRPGEPVQLHALHPHVGARLLDDDSAPTETAPGVQAGLDGSAKGDVNLAGVRVRVGVIVGAGVVMAGVDLIDVEVYADRETGGRPDARRARSFDEPIGEDSTLADSIGITDPELGRAEIRVLIDGALDVLTARDREILRLRFEEDLTQTEISRQIGVSQMQVSRLIRQALARRPGPARPPPGRSARPRPFPDRRRNAGPRAGDAGRRIPPPPGLRPRITSPSRGSPRRASAWSPTAAGSARAPRAGRSTVMCCWSAINRRWAS